MKHTEKRALFEICQGNVSLDVMNVDSLSCDNAAAVLGDKFVAGNFTDEFINHWFGTVQDILANGDDVTDEARSFFESHNVDY